MKTKIQFSGDGSSFSLVLDTDSIEISSKEAGYKKIKELAEEKKISVSTFRKMRDQILQAENLPWGESKGSISVSILSIQRPSVFDIFGSSFGFSRPDSSLMDAITDIGMLSALLSAGNKPKEPVEEPYFEMCECGEAHGWIFYETTKAGPIENKKEGFEVLDQLQQEELISIDDVARVREQIESSQLPEE